MTNQFPVILAVGDVVWQALIAAGLAIVMAWMGRRNEKKLDVITKTGDAVHTLVNSNFGVQLNIAAIALRRVADLTKEPSDIKAANIADKALADHESRQAVVDSEEKTDEKARVADLDKTAETERVNL